MARAPRGTPIESFLALFFNLNRSRHMSKVQQSNKEAKKQPALTPKEKKAAKQVKKHAGDTQPLMTKGS